MNRGIWRWKFSWKFRRRSDVIGGIEVTGNSDFLLRTKEALTLLQPLAEFALIRMHLATIRQARRSGMKAWLPSPMFTVGKPTWQHSALWYAGAIAHDAYHAKLYREAKKRRGETEPDVDDWTGAEAEKKCLGFQRQVLLALDADEKLIRYLESCAENPTYQGYNKGWRGWLDYLGRRW
jgi:hypothetical protein